MIEQNLCVAIASLSLAIASVSFIPGGDTIRAQTPLLSQNSSPKPNNSISVMEAVARAVLTDAAKRTGKPISELTVSKIEQQDWSDGCLGLPAADTLCTEAIVRGWRVVVTSNTQSWVYRTNTSGSLIKWDAAASQTPSAVSPNPEDEDNPAILPDPKPSKLPLRIVDVSPSNGNRRKPNIAVSPRPITPSPTPRATSKPSPVVVLPSPDVPATPSPTPRATPKPSPVVVLPSPKPSVNRRVRTTASIQFRDIPQAYWARDFIAELAQRDIIKGSGNRFRPTDPVTNAEFAAMLSLAFPRPNVRGAIDFADITPQEWAHSYLLEAYQRGFLEVGSGNKMYPNRQVSRLNVLTALTRGLKYTATEPAAETLKLYQDASAIPSEFGDIVAAATEKGLVVNYPNAKMLKPNRRATRAEVAALIYQAMVSTGQAERLDSPYIVLKPSR